MDDEYTHVCADCGLGVPDEDVGFLSWSCTECGGSEMVEAGDVEAMDDLPECGTSETYEASQWEEDAMAPDGGCD